jgi:hypothetical protein
VEQILNSHSRHIAPIVFPEYAGRQYYMATTMGHSVSLPEGIEAYNVPVQKLCDLIEYKGIIHVTIDEKVVKKGHTQRKPELHVDGRFTGASWGHPSPGWNHFCNELPIQRMSVAVASSLARCKVYNGVFIGTPNEQGDLSHIRNQVGEGDLVPANEWYLLSPDCVHESLPFDYEAPRSFIRVAFEDEVLLSATQPNADGNG